MNKFVVTHFESPLASSLIKETGIDPRCVHRIVLDLTFGKPGVLTLETFADDRMLKVLPDGVGIEVWPDDYLPVDREEIDVTKFSPRHEPKPPAVRTSLWQTIRYVGRRVYVR